MGHTIFEKILLTHLGAEDIRTGDLVEVEVDRVMIHDYFTSFCVSKFNEMGFRRIFDPAKVVIVYDHLVPATFPDDRRHHRITEEFAALHGITNIHRTDGICHQVMLENGYVKPGDIVLGSDSHTVTYGAVGALSTSIGYTEMAAVLGTGKVWLKVAPTIRVVVNGRLSKAVYSKDVALKVIGALGVGGATYKILEFSGTTLADMSVEARLTLSNMSVEAGAKAGLIEPDDKVMAFLGQSAADVSLIRSDESAAYESELECTAEDIPPLVACPFNVDNVKPAAELEGKPIDQAFLGSCTNGRLEDLEVASRILAGKKVDRNVRLYVVPASTRVYAAAIGRGYIQTMVEAGAIVNHPACSLCLGRSGGILENGDTVISSSNRNFLGRMGGEKVEIFLASPATVAASALAGTIVDPRPYVG